MPRIFARITKVDEETRTVHGRAAQELVDRDQEIFHYDSSKPEFMKWSAEVSADTDGASLGNVRAMHGNVAAGKLTDIEFDDIEKAIDVSAKIVDDNEWKKVLEGVYTGFSIGGRYAKKWPAAVNGKMVNYYTAVPSEISIVDRPCNPTAKFFSVHKKDGTVEKRAFSSKERDEAADTGEAMPDGSFPIKSKKDLKNAIQAHGRAKDPEKAKAHIKSRAKALGAESLLPDDWQKVDEGDVKKDFSMPTSATSGVSNYDQEGAKKPVKKFEKKEFKGNQHRKGGTVADKMRASNRLSVAAHQMTADARLSTSPADHQEAAAAHTAAAASYKEVTECDKDDQYGAQAAADQHTAQAAFHLSRCDKVDEGELKKGLPEVYQLACLAYQIACLAEQQNYERIREGDDSGIPEKLRDSAAGLLQLVSEMAAEEGHELGELEFNEGEIVSTAYPGTVTSVPNDIGKVYQEIVDRISKFEKTDLVSKVQDAVTELGALCNSASAEDSDSVNSQEDIAMNKGTGTGTVGSEGAKRGAQVTSPSLPSESENGEDAERTSDQGQEKPASNAKKGKKGGSPFKERKMEMSAKDDDEDDDDDGDEDDDDSKDTKKAKKYDDDDLAKAIAVGVRQALNALNKSDGGEVIPRRTAAPALLAVGKGGEMQKISSVDDLKKSVTANQYEVNEFRTDDHGRKTGDLGTATLIKAIRANPVFRLRPEEIPSSF